MRPNRNATASSSKPLAMLVEDHSVVRMGVRQTLEEDFQILECSDAAQAHATIGRFHPDLAIVDLSLPDCNGLSLIRELKNLDGYTPGIIAFSRHSDPGIIRRAMDLGAHAYVNKRASLHELRQGLNAVTRGERYLDTISTRELERAGQLSSSVMLDRLTPREAQLLGAMAEGLCANGLARRFNISTNTVGNHRRNMMKKLGVNSLAELTRLAAQLELPHTYA